MNDTKIRYALGHAMANAIEEVAGDEEAKHALASCLMQTGAALADPRANLRSLAMKLRAVTIEHQALNGESSGNENLPG